MPAPIGVQRFRIAIVLLDEATGSIQLALIHPDNVPEVARALLPELPPRLSPGVITALLDLRLPQ